MNVPARDDGADSYRTLVRHRSLGPPADPAQEYWSPETETCSREELRELQSSKLRALIRLLYERSSFYRRRLDDAGIRPADIRGVDDLGSIPFTTKPQLAEDALRNPPWGSFDLLSEDDWRSRGWLVASTSGTTAAPMHFRFTLHDRDQFAWNYARAIWSPGIRPGSGPMFIALPYTPHVYCWGVHYACNLLGIPVIPAGNMDTERRALVIRELRPALLCSTPSYCLYLGHALKDMGLDPAETSVRWLLIAGEPGGSVAGTKRRLEHLWGARVVEAYGSTEGSPSPGGYQCRITCTTAPYGVHLAEDTQIWEVVDPVTLNPVGDGQLGVAVVTNLHLDSTPLLRFVIGDYARLSTERCECGRTHARAVGGFQGRTDDALNVRGINVLPSVVEDVVRSFDELTSEFELTLQESEGREELTLRVETVTSLPPGHEEEVAERLSNRVRLATEIRPRIQLLPEGSLDRPTFKARRTRTDVSER